MGYSPEFLPQLQRFNCGQVIIGPYRQNAANAPDAQINDLAFRQQLEKFKEVDSELATAILKTWDRHVEFVSPEYSFFSLVSSKVSQAEKRKIADEILATPDPKILTPAPPKPAVPINAETQLHELARSPRAYLAFHLLNIDAGFLTKDPSDWENDASFSRLASFARNFKVVNDAAEHAIQLTSDYNELITKDEDQRQCLYIGVNKRRRERDDLRRKTLEPNPAKRKSTPAKDRSHLKRGQ